MTNWDPFLDAEKFEQLAIEKEARQKKRIQAQFAIITRADKLEKQRIEEQTKEENFEESIQIVEDRLAQKESQLRQREEMAKKL